MKRAGDAFAIAVVRVPLILGTVSLALILGALGFQYGAGFAPCDVCHWQRWPHIANAIVGVLGGAAIARGIVDAKWATGLAYATIALMALGGALGVYHAGVEWNVFQGPEHCSGPSIVFRGLEGLGKDPVVRCDRAAWRFLQISLAGYNALVSLGAATAGVFLLRAKR